MDPDQGPSLPDGALMAVVVNTFECPIHGKGVVLDNKGCCPASKWKRWDVLDATPHVTVDPNLDEASKWKGFDALMAINALREQVDSLRRELAMEVGKIKALVAHRDALAERVREQEEVIKAITAHRDALGAELDKLGRGPVLVGWAMHPTADVVMSPDGAIYVYDPQAQGKFERIFQRMEREQPSAVAQVKGLARPPVRVYCQGEED